MTAPMPEAHLKHLEFIQAVISRLSTHSFAVKGLTITISAALVGVALSGDQWLLGLAAAVVVSAFWALDASLVRSERLFRLLYDHARNLDSAVELLAMSAMTDEFRTGLSGKDAQRVKWLRVGFSRTLLLFYLTLLGISLAASLVALTTDENKAPIMPHPQFVRTVSPGDIRRSGPLRPTSIKSSEW